MPDTPSDSNFRKDHQNAFVHPKTGTAGYSVPNDFEDDGAGSDGDHDDDDEDQDGDQDSEDYDSED